MLLKENVGSYLTNIQIDSRKPSREELLDIDADLPVRAVGEFSLGYREALIDEKLIKDELNKDKHGLSPNQIESILAFYSFLKEKAFRTGKYKEVQSVNYAFAYSELQVLHDEKEIGDAAETIRVSDAIFMDRDRENMYCVYNKQVHVIELR
jgi:hypothetical protein